MIFDGMDTLHIGRLVIYPCFTLVQIRTKYFFQIVFFFKFSKLFSSEPTETQTLLYHIFFHNFDITHFIVLALNRTFIDDNLRKKDLPSASLVASCRLGLVNCRERGSFIVCVPARTQGLVTNTIPSESETG